MKVHSEATDQVQASGLIDRIAGGLRLDFVKKHVSAFLKHSGGRLERLAGYAGLLPNEEKVLQNLHRVAQQRGITGYQDLLDFPDEVFGTVWKSINRTDWEEFCVPSNDNLDLSECEDFIQFAKADAAFERPIQALAECKFPQLYMLRSIAVGLTCTDEDWKMRIKLNTFRAFVLRLALPGTKYDKFISAFVVVTSGKDAWDELKAGENSRGQFAADFASNVLGTRLGQFFEKRFSVMLHEKWAEFSDEK